MVNVLTKEPPQKSLQRHLDYFDATMKVYRSSCFDMADFVAKFTGKASKFLRLVGSQPGDAMEQIVSLIMLHSAQLAPSVLQAAKLALQSKAVEASATPTPAEIAQTKIKERLEAIRSICAGIPSGAEPAIATFVQSILAELGQIENCLTRLHTVVSSGPLPLDPSPRFEMQLTDAAQTLLTVSSDECKRAPAKEKLERTVEKRLAGFSKALLSVQHAIDKQGPAHRQGKERVSRTLGGPSKFRVRPARECWDCCSISHLRGDRSCMRPSDGTKRAWSIEDQNESKK
jgi:hypothetical protein